MTLPASGNMTRSQIRTEFGLSAASRWPTDFFGLGGAPGARPLKWSDFHGRSHLPAAPVFDLAPGTYDYGDPGNWGVNADRPLVWTWSSSGHAVSGSVSSGGTASSISFTFGTNNTFSVWSATVNLSTTYNGVTYSWTVNMTNTGIN
jgi:hypothetical protein